MKTTIIKTIPRIYNFYKPKDITSYDVIRKFKKHLPKNTKLGHFGTLDPFARGVLMIGVDGAQRLNEYIHSCLPKTYIAEGILGVSTPTGDLTVEIENRDESDYLNNQIANFDSAFIEKQLSDKFLGEYWQAPHKFSAAKFEGRPLHEWARAGVEIKKDKKKRFIYSLRVLSYEFPKLNIEFKVSSGTYIRTLFSDCAAFLGTLGVLEGLERTAVGDCLAKNAIDDFEHLDEMAFCAVDEVLEFSSFILAEKEANLYKNGVRLKCDRIFEEKMGSLPGDLRWIRNIHHEILGLAEIREDEFHSLVNFAN